MIHHSIIILFIALGLQVNAQVPKKLNGLAGTWQYTQGMQGYEVWQQMGDTLIGNGFLVKHVDTTHYETLKIYRAGKKLMLSIQLTESTGNKPLVFATKNRRTLFFSHPSHDFPRAISFSKVKPKTNVVTVTLFHPHESALPFVVLLGRK
jgi:hypothetical protein